MFKWLKLPGRGSHINGIERCGALIPRTLPVDSGALKVLAFWTISNLAVLCTYETRLALLQHIQT